MSPGVSRPNVCAILALLAVALAALVPAQAQSPTTTASAPPAAAEGTPLTVLLFHPNDGVDPLGFAAAGSDAFAARYGPLVAEKGRFDFPFFVADGVLPIEAIPDPSRPYVSALQAYEQAVAARASEESPVALRLASTMAGAQVLLAVQATARVDLADEDLRLRVALVEDHVEYQPPPGLTNGVTDHRFTVRGYVDLGVLDLTAFAPLNATHSFLLDDAWDLDQLSVAAWLQVDAPSPRFDAREVVQATHATVGDDVVQSRKGVLAEMLSATWCDPCLYGDQAIEALAIAQGVAEPASAAPSSRYLQVQRGDAWILAAAGALGVAVVLLARRSA